MQIYVVESTIKVNSNSW